MYNAPILKKAVEVIKLIVKENKPLGVTDISRSLSISKSTTFGILKSLEEEGFLVQDKETEPPPAGSRWVRQSAESPPVLCLLSHCPLGNCRCSWLSPASGCTP